MSSDAFECEATRSSSLLPRAAKPDAAILGYRDAVEFAEAIENLYDTFAPYPRRDEIDACSHCVVPEDHEALARIPLRALSHAQLEKYAVKAMTTWGEAVDYKHFLPRILELAVAEEGRGRRGTDLETIADKIDMAGGNSWPEVERRALAHFFEALWRTVLAHDPARGGWTANECLPAIAAIVGEIAPYLDTWENTRSLASTLQLADFVDSNWPDIANRRRLQGSWPEVLQRHMERWLLAPARQQALQDTFERHAYEPEADRLAAAFDAWQWMASSLAEQIPNRSNRGKS